MTRSWTRWGLAAALALAVAPGARAAEESKAERKAEEAGAEAREAGREAKKEAKEAAGEAKREGSEVRASAETQTKTGDARTTAPDSATTGNTDRMGSSTGARAAGGEKVSRHDNSDIITKLHAANVMEVEAAKIAKDNAEREDVKQFAERMEKDHGELKDALEGLADDRNLKLDEGAAEKPHEAHFSQMKEMKGDRFDRHYASMMVQHHDKSMKEVESALKRAQQSGDHELAQVLQNAQTTIRTHQRLAKDLEKGKGQRMGRRGEGGRDATRPSADQGAAGAHGGATDQGQQHR